MPLPGGVIRKEVAEDLTPVPFQFSDIRALAARILKRAQEQAQQKLEAARKQVSDMEKEAQKKAYDEAFPKGEKEGFKKGEAEGKATAQGQIKEAVTAERQAFQQNVTPVTTMLQDLTNIINEHRQFIITQAEADLLLLSVDIAKRLIGRELSVDSEVIRPIAIEAIGLVTDRSNILARVNPDDLAIMEDEIPNLQLLFPDLGIVKLEADPSIERGGLVAQTREGEVDMRLSTRLAAIEDSILGFSGQAADAPWSAIDPAIATEQLAQLDQSREAANHVAQAARDRLVEAKEEAARQAEEAQAAADAELAAATPPPEPEPEPEPEQTPEIAEGSEQNPEAHQEGDQGENQAAAEAVPEQPEAQESAQADPQDGGEAPTPQQEEIQQ